MKNFRFKEFQIAQNSKVFRVGTDGVLLGALANATHAHCGLEVGSGTGLISLMLAQRFPHLSILAIDIDEAAANLTKLNFSASPFSQRLQSAHMDFNNFKGTEKFDFIFSNPPYFKAEISKDFIARQQASLDFKRLISNARKVISENGTLAVILPSESADEFVSLAKEKGFYCSRIVEIYGIAGGVLRRKLLEFTLHKNEKFKLETFIIEKSERVYSEQYVEVTKDFHPQF